MLTKLIQDKIDQLLAKMPADLKALREKKLRIIFSELFGDDTYFVSKYLDGFLQETPTRGNFAVLEYFQNIELCLSRQNLTKENYVYLMKQYQELKTELRKRLFNNLNYNYFNFPDALVTNPARNIIELVDQVNSYTLVYYLEHIEKAVPMFGQHRADKSPEMIKLFSALQVSQIKAQYNLLAFLEIVKEVTSQESNPERKEYLEDLYHLLLHVLNKTLIQKLYIEVAQLKTDVPAENRGSQQLTTRLKIYYAYDNEAFILRFDLPHLGKDNPHLNIETSSGYRDHINFLTSTAAEITDGLYNAMEKLLQASTLPFIDYQKHQRSEKDIDYFDLIKLKTTLAQAMSQILAIGPLTEEQRELIVKQIAAADREFIGEELDECADLFLIEVGVAVLRNSSFL